MHDSPPSKTPKKLLYYTKGEVPNACSAEDVEGVVDVVRPVVAINFGVNMSAGGGLTLASPAHMSLLASLGPCDLDGLMGQALANLAMTFDFELPPKGSNSMVMPPFEFPTLLSLASTPSNSKFPTNIYDTFSMGVARVMASEVVTPIDGST